MFPLSISRFLGTWAGLAVAMSINGIARELLLKRLVSSSLADILSAGIGILLIGLITRFGFRSLATSNPTTGQLVGVSAALVILTVLFEGALGRWIDHKSWTLLLQHYAIWRGELWPLLLLWLGVTPFAWAHRWFGL